MKLSLNEIQTIREYASHKRFAHFSITALSWFAKKSGVLFASPSSWSRIIREFNIRRPTKRIYPPKPKVGIRASHNNEIWHLDLSVIRLINNARAFIQSIIDNRSRYVLATRVSLDYGGRNTKKLLRLALIKGQSFGYFNKPQVFVDSGTENLNKEVDGLITDGVIERLVAQIDINFSNSLIEMFFSRLKNAYLYLQQLTDFSTLSCHTAYYVREHNEVIPHSALMGATPLEIYSNTWTANHQLQLQQAHRTAIAQRIRANHNTNCGLCPT